MNWIKQNKLIAAAIGLLIVAAIGGGIWYYRKRQGQLREAAGVVPAETKVIPIGMTKEMYDAANQTAGIPTKEDLLAQQATQNAAWQKVGLWHEVTEAEAKAAEGKPALLNLADRKPFFGFLQAAPTGQTAAFEPLNDRQIKAMWETRKQYYLKAGVKNPPALKKDTPFIQAMARNIASRFWAKPAPGMAIGLSIIPNPAYFGKAVEESGTGSGKKDYNPAEISKLIAAQL